jgi:DNA primase
MLFSGQRKQSNTDGLYTSGQIESLLRSCDIKIGGEIDTHFLIFCPFHYNVNTPACEVDKSNGMFICFSCGETGSILDMIMRTTNRNYFEAMRMINSRKDVIDIEREVEQAIEATSDLPEFDMDLISRLHQSLMNSDRAKKYFAGRNITEESAISFMLGYSEKQDMVIVPVFSVENVCLGFVARSIEGKSFKNSTGLPKSKTLFNINNVKRQKMVVVESSFDVIRLSQLNIPAVATLGATVSKAQISLLQTYASSIIVCPDNDDAGAGLIDKIIKNIKNKEVEVIRLNRGKDIGDLADNEILDTFNNAGNKLVLAV